MAEIRREKCVKVQLAQGAVGRNHQVALVGDRRERERVACDESEGRGLMCEEITRVSSQGACGANDERDSENVDREMFPVL